MRDFGARVAGQQQVHEKNMNQLTTKSANITKDFLKKPLGDLSDLGG
jgi:hypothetical protein